MNIHIGFVISLLLIQFIILRGDVLKMSFVKLRNKHIKPWFKTDEFVYYNGQNYQVNFIFDSDWDYKYYLCNVDPKTHFGKCEMVYQYKLRKKSLLEKELE